MNPSTLFSQGSGQAILDLLSATAWADEQIQPHELDAILATGFFLAPTVPPPSLISSVVKARTMGLPDSIERLSVGERHVAFALAAWVSTVDGVESESELAFLELVQARLGLDAEVAERLLSMARWVHACRPAQLPTLREFGVIVVESLNVLARVDAPWPPRRDPFHRFRDPLDCV